MENFKSNSKTVKEKYLDKIKNFTISDWIVEIRKISAKPEFNNYQNEIVDALCVIIYNKKNVTSTDIARVICAENQFAGNVYPYENDVSRYKPTSFISKLGNNNLNKFVTAVLEIIFDDNIDYIYTVNIIVHLIGLKEKLNIDNKLNLTGIQGKFFYNEDKIIESFCKAISSMSNERNDSAPLLGGDISVLIKNFATLQIKNNDNLTKLVETICTAMNNTTCKGPFDGIIRSPSIAPIIKSFSFFGNQLTKDNIKKLARTVTSKEIFQNSTIMDCNIATIIKSFAEFESIIGTEIKTELIENIFKRILDGSIPYYYIDDIEPALVLLIRNDKLMLENKFIEEINKFFNSETLLVKCKEKKIEGSLINRIKIANNLLIRLKPEEQSQTVDGVLTLNSGQQPQAPAQL